MLASASAPTLAKASSPAPRWDSAHCSGAETSSIVKSPFSTSANQVIAGMRQSFRACYNAELKSGVDAAGSIRYVAKIGPTGAVLGARGIALGLSPDMAQCAGEHVLRANFGPTDPGGATVVIPVTFEVDQSFHLARLPF